MRAESPVLSTERRMVEQLLLSSRRDQAAEATTHDPAGDGGAEQDYVPSRDGLWEFAHEHFPVMHDLYDELVENIDPSGRLSLLKEFVAENALGCILQRLTRRIQHYTAKLTSIFLHIFNSSELRTQTQYGSNDPKYVRLATLDIGRKKVQGYDAASHDVQDFFESEKSLELILLVNKLVGVPMFYFASPGKQSILDRALDEYDMRSLFERPINLFNSLFQFFERYQAPFEVEAVRHYDCDGNPDLEVIVTAYNRVNGKLALVKEHLAMVEYTSPNAGLWIAWKLLSGETFTEDEKSAFFELQHLPSDSDTAYLLDEWQKADSWDAAKEVLEQVGRDKVDVKYDKKQDPNRMDEQDEISKAQATPNTMDIAQKESSDELVPSYFANGKDITDLLKRAKFDTCLDTFHDALAKISRCAVLKSCSRVAIADGLSIIAGSLHELEKSQHNSNPLGSDNVLDVHFYKSYIMQTHDKNSSLYLLNFFCNSAMSSRPLREFVFRLLSEAKRKRSTPVLKVTKADQNRVKEFMSSAFTSNLAGYC